jgi:hypothetical protein
MEYTIKIEGSGSVRELISALHRICDTLETNQEEDTSYTSVSDELDLAVDITKIKE